LEVKALCLVRLSKPPRPRVMAFASTGAELSVDGARYRLIIDLRNHRQDMEENDR